MPGRNKITFFVLLHFRLRFFEMHVYNFLSEYPDTRENWITIFNVRFSFDRFSVILLLLLRLKLSFALQKRCDFNGIISNAFSVFHAF